MLYDPTSTVALQSLDFGNVYSADGREHQVTALTPVVAVDVPGVLAGSSTSSTPTIPAGFSAGDLWDTLTGKYHIGARLVIGVVAIGLILIVAFRLTKS